MRIDIIIELSAEFKAQAVILIPCGISFRSKLDSAQNTQGICGARVDRLRLLDEIAYDRQCISGHLSRCHCEVLIGKTKVCYIHIIAFRDRQSHRYCRQRADPLCQLQKEIPRRAPLLIAAGQHIQKACQLFGDRHLGHIDRKCICCFCALFRIKHIVGILILFIL